MDMLFMAYSNMDAEKKTVKWAPGAHAAIMELPEAIRREFGHELY